jgi:CHRD domain-containing protein
MRDHLAVILPFALIITAIAGVCAQESHTFKGRLSPVPISADMVSRITGSGSITGELRGTTLTLAGLFTGLQTPATLAHVHIGERTGVRGPAVFDVRVDTATTGSMSATIELNESHIASLRRGLFYVQIHSEKAADGNIWGWLLPVEEKK